MVDLVHELLLLGCETIGVFGIDGGKGVALERIFLAVESDCALVVVDVVKHESVGHLPLGVAFDDGSLLLKLQNGYGFVH